MFSRLGSSSPSPVARLPSEGRIGQEIAVAPGADMRAAHHEPADALGVGERRHHRRLPALRVADPPRPRNAEGFEQRNCGARPHREPPAALRFDGARRFEMMPSGVWRFARWSEGELTDACGRSEGERRGR